jgi:uncharacterized Tic20 family protein
MKTAIIVLVLGVALVGGSLAPFGMTIMRGMDANPVLERILEVGTVLETATFAVDTENLVQVAVRIELFTPSVQENALEFGDRFTARYRFPFEYRLLDAAGAPLQHRVAYLSWQSGQRTITDRNIDQRGGTVTVESAFAKRRIAPPGRIQIQARIDRDDTYDAEIRDAWLIVYDGVYDHTRPILAGIIMLMLGGPLTLLGTVLVVVRLVATAPTSGGALPERADLGSERASGATFVGDDARHRAMWCHVSALAGYLIPLAGLIAPLVIWLLNRDRAPFIDDQGKEAVNFRISMYLYYLAAFLLIVVLLGVPLLLFLALFDLVVVIIAAVRASDGDWYRYPLRIRWIR